MKWRSGLALLGIAWCLTTLPACALLHPAGNGATPANSSPAPDLRSSNQANNAGSRTDSPYHPSSSDGSTGVVSRAAPPSPFAMGDKPRAIDRAAEASSLPSTYTAAGKVPEISTPTINPPDLSNQSAYPGEHGVTVPPYPEYIPRPERFTSNPPLTVEEPKPAGSGSATPRQAPPTPNLGASNGHNIDIPGVVTWSTGGAEKKDSADQKSPDLTESRLLAFMRLYLAKKPEEAVAQFSGYDKMRQELLLGLLSAAVVVNEDGTKSLNPEDVTNIVNLLKGMALPLFPKASLIISKACLCSTVRDYGVYEPIPARYLYLPEGHMQIYIELQNYSKVLNKNGADIVLSSRVDFFTEEGNSIPNTHIDIRDPRWPTSSTGMTLDTHRAISFYLPQALPPGKYKMKLQVEDVPTHRTAEHTFDITIGDPRRRM